MCHITPAFFSPFVHAYPVNPTTESAKILVYSPGWNLLNTLWIRYRVDAESGRSRILLNPMTQQNRFQYLPREHPTWTPKRMQSLLFLFGFILSLIACFKLNLSTFSLHLNFMKRRLNIWGSFRCLTVEHKQLKRAATHVRPRRFWIRPGRTSAWWDNFVSERPRPAHALLTKFTGKNPGCWSSCGFVRMRVDGQILFETLSVDSESEIVKTDTCGYGALILERLTMTLTANSRQPRVTKAWKITFFKWSHSFENLFDIAS